MLWHREPELGDGGAAVGEKAPAELGVDPGPGHDPGAVLRNPLLLGELSQLLDGFRSVHAALVERLLDRIDAALDRGGALDDRTLIRHGRPSSLCCLFLRAAEQYSPSMVVGQPVFLKSAKGPLWRPRTSAQADATIPMQVAGAGQSFFE